MVKIETADIVNVRVPSNILIMTRIMMMLEALNDDQICINPHQVCSICCQLNIDGAMATNKKTIPVNHFDNFSSINFNRISCLNHNCVAFASTDGSCVNRINIKMHTCLLKSVFQQFE